GAPGAAAELGAVDLAEAVLHRGGVEVHAERVGREVVEVVGEEAGYVCGDLEARVAELLVEGVVAGLAGPLEDAVRALADEGVGVGPVEAALALALLDEPAGVAREDLALPEEGLDAGLRGLVEVVGEQERREDAVLGAGGRAEGGGDDGLALRADVGHVV